MHFIVEQSMENHKGSGSKLNARKRVELFSCIRFLQVQVGNLCRQGQVITFLSVPSKLWQLGQFCLLETPTPLLSFYQIFSISSANPKKSIQILIQDLRWLILQLIIDWMSVFRQHLFRNNLIKLSFSVKQGYRWRFCRDVTREWQQIISWCNCSTTTCRQKSKQQMLWKNLKMFVKLLRKYAYIT